jgi:hypothetical protein
VVHHGWFKPEIRCARRSCAQSGVKVPQAWWRSPQGSERKNRMVRSNQPPKPEGCSVEGQAPGLRPADRTTTEKRTSGKTRAVSRIRLLLKRWSLERDKCKRGRGRITGTQNRSDRHGEGAEGLPGSESAARDAEGAWNRGGPGHSCRTNYASQAGKAVQRQGARSEGAQGVGSAHSSQQSWRRSRRVGEARCVDGRR